MPTRSGPLQEPAAGRQKGRRGKIAKKSREWVLLKKESMRRQGHEVSKFMTEADNADKLQANQRLLEKRKKKLEPN